MSERPPPRPRVLIVDDEPLNRDLLRRCLQRDYEVEEAADAAGAMQILTRRRRRGFRLVISDQIMPGRSGTELAGEIHQRWPALPVLLLTGFDGDPAVARATALGILGGVVMKPWRSAALRAAIAGALALPT